MKILTIFIFFIFITNHANAYNIVDQLNNSPKVKKDIQMKLSQHGDKLTKYSYSKNFAYCDQNNGALQCRNENIFCIIIPWHKGDYNLNYEVYACNWIKYPSGYYKEIEKDAKMAETHVKVTSGNISGGVSNLKTRWVPKKEYEESLKNQGGN